MTETVLSKREKNRDAIAQQRGSPSNLDQEYKVALHHENPKVRPTHEK